MRKTSIAILSLSVVAAALLSPSAWAAASAGIAADEEAQRSRLSDDAGKLLEKNGFVVVPSRAFKNMNEAYKAFRSENVPLFLTTDSILHTTHSLFDYLLRTVESGHLMGDLKRLTGSMLAASVADYEAAGDERVKKAARANIAFFSVAGRLFDENLTIPRHVETTVEDELGLIEKHQGFSKSPIFGYLEDYSQYVPRGHYTISEEFKSYFKVMMWYGRMGFYLNPDRSLQVSDGLTRQLTVQALLMVRGLNSSGAGSEISLEMWEKIYEPTAFFVGKTDDLNVEDYKNIALGIYGKIPALEELSDESRLRRFMSEARRFRRPGIYSSGVDAGQGAEAPPLNFRFMGQRFTPDSYILQNLVYPRVTSYTGNSRPFTLAITPGGPIRGFPRGLDIMAALGSGHAEDIIKGEGDGDYQGYPEQLEKLKKEFDLTEEEWTSNLYWSWIYCLRPLLSSPGDNAPPFMKNRAWAMKSLNAALGSWAELRHDTILYAKQSYTALTGMPTEPRLTRGYVEPYPEIYARARRMTEQTRKGMLSRGLLDKGMESKLSLYENLLVELETIANKELSGTELTEQEYRTIWNIGPKLESVTKFPRDTGARVAAGIDGEMAVIADVHTDPNSAQVLEEAVGTPFIIHVRVSVNGKEQELRGPVFSYYEFKQPIPERLTDEQWQRMLKENREPRLPEWTGEFIRQ